MSTSSFQEYSKEEQLNILTSNNRMYFSERSAQSSSEPDFVKSDVAIEAIQRLKSLAKSSNPGEEDFNFATRRIVRLAQSLTTSEVNTTAVDSLLEVVPENNFLMLKIVDLAVRKFPEDTLADSSKLREKVINAIVDMEETYSNGCISRLARYTCLPEVQHQDPKLDLHAINALSKTDFESFISQIKKIGATSTDSNITINALSKTDFESFISQIKKIGATSTDSNITKTVLTHITNNLSREKAIEEIFDMLRHYDMNEKTIDCTLNFLVENYGKQVSDQIYATGIEKIFNTASKGKPTRIAPMMNALVQISEDNDKQPIFNNNKTMLRRATRQLLDSQVLLKLPDETLQDLGKAFNDSQNKPIMEELGVKPEIASQIASKAIEMNSLSGQLFLVPQRS